LTKKGAPKTNSEFKNIMDKLFVDLTEEEKEKLDCVAIDAWDLIQANSGGHPSITNISGLNFVGRSKRPPSKSSEPKTYAPKTKSSTWESKPKNETLYLTLMKDISEKIKTRLEKEITKY